MEKVLEKLKIAKAHIEEENKNYALLRIEEAIAEVEAQIEAMKPKTCSSCKYWGNESDVGEKNERVIEALGHIIQQL